MADAFAIPLLIRDRVERAVDGRILSAVARRQWFGFKLAFRVWYVRERADGSTYGELSYVCARNHALRTSEEVRAGWLRILEMALEQEARR